MWWAGWAEAFIDNAIRAATPMRWSMPIRSAPPPATA
jgi:hypothetical protein